MTRQTSLVPPMRSGELDPANAQSVSLADSYRDSKCTRCSLSEYAQNVCLPGEGPVPARGMIVADAPGIPDDENGRPLHQSTEAAAYFDAVIRDADLDRADLYVTYAVKCRPPYGDRRADLIKVAQKECAVYLDSEIAAVKPRAVLSMGAPGYYYFTHAQGIMKHRGQAVYDAARGLWVVPTVSPIAVLTNPALEEDFTADVKKFRRLMLGIDDAPRVNVIEVRTIEDLRAMVSDLDSQAPAVLTFDLETRGFNDVRVDGTSFVWTVALTRGHRTRGLIDSYVVPLEHPESPFLDDVGQLREAVGSVVGLVQGSRCSGHNVKFDYRWLEMLRLRYAECGDEALRDAARRLKEREYWPVVAPKRRGKKAILAEQPELPMGSGAIDRSSDDDPRSTLSDEL